ncbi:hypothetical protein L810_8725 [Burkholderia sp. AU4i]|nr:hypothetical protein L810_8725 [Burkholderia sp. AU4i]
MRIEGQDAARCDVPAICGIGPGGCDRFDAGELPWGRE